MTRIIINADDFGLNEAATTEIERMIVLGAVSSTTVMANGTQLGEVKRFAIEHPEISYGVHLCLSEFASVTKSDALYRAGLTDEMGFFIRKAVFGLKNLTDPIVKNAIRDELNAQIDIVSSLGFPISHADSHHHAHTIFPLKEVFADILKERGIKKLRLGLDFRSWRSKRHFILWLQREKLNRFYKSNFVTSDAFYSYGDYIRRGSQKNGMLFELMCHPGHPWQQYCEEMRLVESKAALKNDEIKLITYNDL